MHRKRDKKRLRIQLTFIYTLMVIAVVSIVAILILVIQGYRYNRFDGKLEQGGLVQFNSRPSGATVTVDSATLANKTANKVTLTAGGHTISMSREGYSSWKKDVVVRPGSVLWLTYALLVPNSPVVETAVQYTAVASALPSPNQKRMAVVADAATPEVQLVTLSNVKSTATKIAIPETAYTAPAATDTTQNFSLLAWDKDSNLLLVRHNYGDKTEYLSFDTRDGKAHNISTELGVDIRKIVYSRGDSNVAYALTAAHELRRLTISSATVSGPLASNVADFTVNEEKVIVYTTHADADGKRTVGYVSSGNNKAKVLATYGSEAGVLLAATGNYYGDHYLTILQGKTLKVLKGDFPSSDSSSKPTLTQVASLTVANSADYLGFSPNSNRIVYAAKGSQIVTYDLELRAHALTTLQDPLTRDVQWLDDYHLFAVGKNGYYYDYDGTNSQLFASNTLDYPVTLSDNDKYIYYFTSTEKGPALQRVRLTTDT